ncbi:MAG: hypothetical protein E6Q67_01495 [Roseateles sp.]|nr:MAG: hypothetical protein E6Q67_01495 [Roseateles sp.]
MRRWLCLLLMVLLPLQFSWAVAAAYCGHEAGGAARHVGHHAHEHAASKAEAGASPQAEHAHQVPLKKTGSTPAGLDNDCGTCHLSLAKPLIAQASTLPPPVHARPEAEPAPALKSRGPDRRDRPNWRLA